MSVLLLLLLFTSSAIAATWPATTASHAHVTAAIGLASAGDTVTIPAGNATWAAPLVVSKMITLQGAGKTQTLITSSHTGIGINVTLQGGGGRCVIRDFQFDGDQIGQGITINDGTTTDNWREAMITGCKLIDCDVQAIDLLGVIATLVYDCEFVDCDRTIHVEGHHDQSWDEPPYIGSYKTNVIEDCTITHSVGTWSNTVISSGGHGMRRVIRYCTTTNNSTKKGSPFLDSHGNQASVVDNNGQGAPESGIRGTRITETYGNTFDESAASGGGNLRIDLRGGINLMWDNNFIGAYWAEVGPFYLREEDNYDPPITLTTPLKTYPGYDPHQLWLWDNTVNGTTGQPTTSTVTWEQPIGKETAHKIQIVDGTNLFFRAPQSGDAVTGSAGAGDGPTTFAPTEAIYPYTALAYPHPWRGVERRPRPPGQARKNSLIR